MITFYGVTKLKKVPYKSVIAILMVAGVAWGIARTEVGPCQALVLGGQYKQAIKGCKALAREGDAIAQFNLGWMYDYGNGVSQDYKKAARWYFQSAKQGYVPAQYNLGWLYKLGDGVVQSNTQAYFWWALAADQGDNIAEKNKSLIVEQMSPKELEQVQALLDSEQSG